MRWGMPRRRSPREPQREQLGWYAWLVRQEPAPQSQEGLSGTWLAPRPTQGWPPRGHPVPVHTMQGEGALPMAALSVTGELI
jgi:hypothetical protein